MPTKQPDWQFIANIGDVSPLEYGGTFIYTDATGVYSPEMERIEMDGKGYEVRRVVLEPCTFINGILSDNPFHPGVAAWFAAGLPDVARSMNYDIDALRSDICGTDVLKRANAWRAILDHYGWENGDSYPSRLTRAQSEARYTHGEL